MFRRPSADGVRESARASGITRARRVVCLQVTDDPHASSAPAIARPIDRSLSMVMAWTGARRRMPWREHPWRPRAMRLGACCASGPERAPLHESAQRMTIRCRSPNC